MNAYQERLTKAARKRRSSGGGSGVGGQLTVGKTGAGGGVGGRHTPSSTPFTSISGPSAAQHQESSSGLVYFLVFYVSLIIVVWYMEYL